MENNTAEKEQSAAQQILDPQTAPLLPSENQPQAAPREPLGDVQSTISDIKIFIEKLKADLPEVFTSSKQEGNEETESKTPAAGKVLYRGDMLDCIIKLTPENKKNSVNMEDNTVTVSITDAGQNVPAVVEEWLRAKAQETLPSEIARWAQKMGVQFNNIVIKDQKTRWASCSDKKNLNFSYRIIKMPLVVADYLIVHELAHLIFFNHGQDYWQTVEQYIPAFKEHRKWLSANRYALMADCNLKYTPQEDKNA